MDHKMKLAPAPFQRICDGKKTVEMRLYDEKRAKIRIGDRIEFENVETRQTLECTVIDLIRFNDFYALYAHFDKTELGYTADEAASAEDMHAYYSPEQVKRYGVVAIKIRRTNDKA